MLGHKITILLKRIWKERLIFLNGLLTLCIIGILIYFYAPVNGSLLKKAEGKNIQGTALTIYTDCHAAQDWHECYKKELSQLTKTEGLPFSQNVLFAIQDVDQNSRNCHVIAHFMAREAYKRESTKWLELSDQADINSCGGGFLHGILEAHIGDSPNQQINAAFADQVCQRKHDDFRERLCYHLFGHFFLVDQDGNITKAVPYCDQIEKKYTYDCDDGLFMEDHQKLALSDHEIAPLPNYTPQYLQSLQTQCTGYTGIESNACWTEIAEIATKVYGYNDPQKVYDACYKAPQNQDKLACYLKGVVVLAIYVGYDTPPKLLSICENYKNTNTYYQCNSYLLSALMHYSVKYADRGITLCSNIDTSIKPWCFQELGKQLHALSSLSEREKLCQNAPADFKESCVSKN